MNEPGPDFRPALEANTGAEPDLVDYERIAHLVRMAARGFSRALQIRLAQHDVTFGQWIYLRLLWKEDGLTQRSLSQRAGLTEPTTHTALQRLEALGYVRRCNLPGNRRRQHAFLTETGWALREKLEPLAVEVNAVATLGLACEDEATLRRILGIILDNLARDEASAQADGRGVPPTRSAAEG